MEVCGRAAAVFVHRETQHIVSGAQAYARRPRAVKKMQVEKQYYYFVHNQSIT
jgi:hypothetical protein